MGIPACFTDKEARSSAPLAEVDHYLSQMDGVRQAVHNSEDLTVEFVVCERVHYGSCQRIFLSANYAISLPISSSIDSRCCSLSVALSPHPSLSLSHLCRSTCLLLPDSSASTPSCPLPHGPACSHLSCLLIASIPLRLACSTPPSLR